MELFGVAKKKMDGTDGSLMYLPQPEDILESPQTRDKFIAYSAFDAEQTWRLYYVRKQNPTRHITCPSSSLPFAPLMTLGAQKRAVEDGVDERRLHNGGLLRIVL